MTKHVSDRPVRISLLMFDQMLVSSLAMPLEMLHAAAAFERTRTRQRLELQVTALEVTTPCRPVGGLAIANGKPFDHKHGGPVDLVIIPALWRNPLRKLQRDDAVCRWLVDRYSEGTRIMAIGTGVWLPARAGLLGNQAATTHWHALNAFEMDFPDVRLKRDHLLTQAGQVYCAASINSGADLMTHLISTVFGSEAAAYVERQFSPEARMSFDKRVFTEDAELHADETIALAQSWLQQRWQHPLSIEGLVEVTGLSARQLGRRFKRVTGITPGDYLLKTKCRFAREWLKNSDLPISDIAQLCGFSDSSHMGRVFKRWQGVSPSEYRRAVRAKLFSANSELRAE